MKMDKTTLLVLASCMFVIIGGQYVINKIWPPVPKPLQPAATTATTNAAAAVTPAWAATNGAAVPQLAPVPAAGLRPAEQLVALSNQFIRVEFTSWGGGIHSVDLFKYKANGKGQVVLNANAPVPALALPGAGGTDTVYEVRQSSPTGVVFQARTASGAVVTKEFTLGADYQLHGRVQITGTAATNLQLVVGTAEPGNAREGTQYLGVDWVAAGKYVNRDFKTVTKNAGKGIHGEPVDTRWLAVKSQFFALIVTAPTNATAVSYESVPLPEPAGWSAKTPFVGLSAALTLPPTAVANGTQTYDFSVYAGPKQYNRLVALGQGQEEVMQFGMWGIISVWLLKSMNFLYGLIPNYGVAIILITIAIKLIFWPIQQKSIKSMKAMQKFQPAMTKLREKFKDDPQRLNQEMMKLYKEHKINPFGGCLPMLVQIPVFFGLFAMLRSAIELRGASFLWIKDLSQPDTIFTIASLPVNPLPLLMTGAMFWQQKLTPTTADNQQQMMMLLMPVMMLFFFYNASSGLALYWTVQQLLSIAQQWWSMRQPDAQPPGPVKVVR